MIDCLFLARLSAFFFMEHATAKLEKPFAI
jgi:hypothetical protein